MPNNDVPISKTQAIRDFLAQHPDSPSGTVAEALANQGIRVTPAHVAVVRSTLESAKRTDAEP